MSSVTSSDAAEGHKSMSNHSRATASDAFDTYATYKRILEDDEV